MTERELTVVGEYDEELIQEVFDRWDRRQGWTIVGAPEWLTRCGAPRQRAAYRTNLKTTFKPDVIFDAERVVYVGELKWAWSNKYNEMAIAEVLHHAWMFRHDPDARAILGAAEKKIQPFIVVPYSAWTRATMAVLLEYGLQPGALHYLEFIALEDEGEKKRFLWLGDPLAPIKSIQPLTWVPRTLHEEFTFWYSGSENTALGTTHELAREERVPFVRGEHVELVRVPGTAQVISARGNYAAPKSWKYQIYNA